MAQYPGLEQMFQNLGPTTASMFAGEQTQLAQDSALQEQLKQQQAIREAKLKNAQSEAMNPLLVSHQQLTNAGQVDTNRKTAVDAALAEGTKDFKLGEAQNGFDIDKLKTAATKQGMFSDMLGKAGVQLQGVPPVQRFAALSQMAQQSGFDINNPAFSNIIQKAQSLDPNKLPEMLTGYSQQLAQLAAKNSTAYIQAMDVAKLHGETSKEVARIGASSRENVVAAKGKGNTTQTNIVLKQSPAARSGSVTGILNSGVNPDTKEPLTQHEKALYSAMLEQDISTVNAQLAARQQPGIMAQIQTDGTLKLVNKPMPGTSAQQAPNSGTTKSGAKFTIEKTP
jgi:hypothetical protein